MAIAALNSAATGLKALSTDIDVIANNLANAETTAFKASRVNFEDLMYLQLKQPGTTSEAGEISPAGVFVGLGTRISNTQLDMSNGTLQSTDRQLDVSIQGNGFFKVKILDTIGDGYGYTRNGNFFVNNNGQLVLGMGDGYVLQSNISIPTGTTNISIDQDGTVSVTKSGSNTKSTVGQLKISQFVNPQGLSLLGGSIYIPTDASGAATDSNPGDNGSGTVMQGFLEGSNVDPVKELTDLISAQR
ncbi:MAG TPA: flagellar basal-body rod protein FlgG, partial [Tepidisphaeraceae bacterium]